MSRKRQKSAVYRSVDEALESLRVWCEAQDRKRPFRRSPIPENPGKGSILEAERLEAQADQCERQGMIERAAILRADAAEHRRLAAL